MALTFIKSDFPAGYSLSNEPAFGSGAYVLITDQGYTWRSTNYGKNWLDIGSRLPSGNWLITYSQNFVAVENAVTGSCYRLVAGSWVQGQSVNISSSSVLYSVNGTTYFIGVDLDTGANVLYSSTNDGASWTILQFADGMSGDGLKSYATNGTNQHVLVGADIAYFSLDGINWQNESIPIGYYNTISWANGLFIAGTNDTQLCTSTNGINWVNWGGPEFSQYSASTLDTFCFGGTFGEASGVISGNGTAPFVSDIYPAYPNKPINIGSSPVNFIVYNLVSSEYSIWYTEPTSSISFGLNWFFAP